METAPVTRFAVELATYHRKLPELLRDAVTSGYERFELDSFFVKQIAAAEQIAFFTRDLEECR